MDAPKTEAQMRTAAMLLVMECALNDLYPGRVSMGGTLWTRRIKVWLNDLEDLIIDFTTDDGIGAWITRADKSGEGGEGDSGGDSGGFGMSQDAGLEEIEAFIEKVVAATASSAHVDADKLVYRISEVAKNSPRLQQAMRYLEGRAAGGAGGLQPG